MPASGGQVLFCAIAKPGVCHPGFCRDGSHVGLGGASTSSGEQASRCEQEHHCGGRFRNRADEVHCVEVITEVGCANQCGANRCQAEVLRGDEDRWS
jgi:hypothetical protein